MFSSLLHASHADCAIMNRTVIVLIFQTHFTGFFDVGLITWECIPISYVVVANSINQLD